MVNFLIIFVGILIVILLTSPTLVKGHYVRLFLKMIEKDDLNTFNAIKSVSRMSVGYSLGPKVYNKIIKEYSLSHDSLILVKKARHWSIVEIVNLIFLIPIVVLIVIGTSALT